MTPLITAGRRWLPDGRRFIFSGKEPGHAARIYLQDSSAGKPVPISPEGIDPLALVLSPDGQQVVGIGPDEKAYFYPVQAENLRPFRVLSRESNRFNGVKTRKAIYFYKPGDLPAKVYRLDLSTGHKTLSKELMPSDSAGVSRHWSYPYYARRQVMLIWLSPILFRPLSGRRTKLRVHFSSTRISAPGRAGSMRNQTS